MVKEGVWGQLIVSRQEQTVASDHVGSKNLAFLSSGMHAIFATRAVLVLADFKSPIHSAQSSATNVKMRKNTFWWYIKYRLSH